MFDIEFVSAVAIQVNKDAVMMKFCTTATSINKQAFGLEFRVSGKYHLVPWHNIKYLKEV